METYVPSIAESQQILPFKRGSALLHLAGTCRPPGRLERILCVLERCPTGPLCIAAGALSLHCDVSYLASYIIGNVDRPASADDARIAEMLSSLSQINAGVTTTVEDRKSVV